MLKRIIIHHTAGIYKPNEIERKHYHFLVDDKGFNYCGYYTPEDNEDCTDDKYAAHTFQGNTGSIGVAACCNYNFKLSSPDSSTRYPLTQKQFEAICELCADLCIKYNIDVANVFTHYSFDKRNNIKQGKVDITYLPFSPQYSVDEIETVFRKKIIWYIAKCNNK